MRRSLLLLTLVSGAAALVYEVVWMRWFRLLFGNTAYAASATLCAFFLGLAIGSVLFGRLAGRTQRPLRTYGWIEIGAAAAAALVPLALRAYDPIYSGLYAQLADGRVGFTLVKFALALAAMLPSAVLLGGTLPVLAAAYVGEGGSLGREGSALYALNVLGGALGAAAGGLVLPELLGVPGTYAAGLGGSLAVGCAALWLARSRDARSAPARVGAASERAPVGALAIAFASGFGILAFQVLLLHALGQYFVHTVYSFGSVLVVVLLCLTAGGGFVAVTERRLPVAPLLAACLLLEAALLLSVPWLALRTRELFLAAAFLPGLSDSPLVISSLAVALLGVPVLLVGSVVFPLTLRLGAGGSAGPRLGGLLAANTVGGILGSLGASFVLLNLAGLWRSFAALGLGYAAVSVVGVRGTRVRAISAATLAALTIATALVPASPWKLPLVILHPDERLLAVSEGAHGIVSVVEREEGGRLIKIDSQYQFGATSEKRLYERTGHLPLLLHRDPRRVLFVGSATGGQAAAAVLHPVESIGLVEIVPEVQTLASEFFAFSNRGVHGDARTRLVVEDGRNHLRAGDERYDVVIEDLFVPQRPSAAAMYTREHYADVRARLTGGGIFCQWLPIYQLSETEVAIIARTFADVFPEATLWRPSFRPHFPILALVGSSGPLPSADAVEARAIELAAYGVDDAWLTDPEGVWTFYVGPVSALLAVIGPAARNTDARPVFEFLSARVPRSVRTRFRNQGWSRLVRRVIRRVGEADPAFPGRPSTGPRGGEALAHVNRLAASGRRQELPRAWPAVRDLVPARLLAQEDRSISMVWP